MSIVAEYTVSLAKEAACSPPDIISEMMMKRLTGNKYLKTITFDNDQAFCLHHEIANELGVKTYFTRPYTSQDKGSI